MNIFEIIREIFDKIADLVFPRTALRRKVESMTPADFVQEVKGPKLPPVLGVHSLFAYRDPLVRAALWNLKFKGSHKSAELFAKLLHDAVLEYLSDEMLFSNMQNPIVIPIPLSKTRMKERGWNQSEMVALALHKLDSNFTVRTDLLLKTKETGRQTKLNRAGRLENLRGCFSVLEKNKKEIQNKNIILLDDIVTTGSTLKESTHTLYKAGARSVICFTLAH